MNAPARHSERQVEILKALPPELAFEFFSEEFDQIEAWFAYAQARADAMTEFDHALGEGRR